MHMMSYDFTPPANSVLITAIDMGGEEVLHSLLEQGVSPNSTNRIGETVLMCLLKPEYPHVEKQIDMLKSLLAYKADPKIIMRFGKYSGMTVLDMLKLSLFNAHRFKLLEILEDHLYLMDERKRKLE